MAEWKLRRAYKHRLRINKRQQKLIKQMYQEVADNIDELIEELALKETDSAAADMYGLLLLKREVIAAMDSVSDRIDFLIRNDMKEAAMAVVLDNREALTRVGLPKKVISVAFEHVPAEVVESIAAGKVYSGEWSLSEAIWKDAKKKQSEINKIVASGAAQNKSAYQIAKDLEAYVDPKAKKDWAWSKVYPHTSKTVDYNAQRLARTMVSHAYQQAFEQTVKPNVFVEGVKWNTTNRVAYSKPKQKGKAPKQIIPCEICRHRANDVHVEGFPPGVYRKGEVPLDHPNGLCYMTAYMPDDTSEIIKRVKAWQDGGQDKELDQMMKDLDPSWKPMSK